MGTILESAAHDANEPIESGFEISKTRTRRTQKRQHQLIQHGYTGRLLTPIERMSRNNLYFVFVFCFLVLSARHNSHTVCARRSRAYATTQRQRIRAARRRLLRRHIFIRQENLNRFHK